MHILALGSVTVNYWTVRSSVLMCLQRAETSSERNNRSRKGSTTEEMSLLVEESQNKFKKNNVTKYPILPVLTALILQNNIVTVGKKKKGEMWHTGGRGRA